MKTLCCAVSTLAPAVVAVAATLASPRVIAAEPHEESDNSVEEIIVTTSLHRSQAETLLPVNVLSGEELRAQVGATLGETLTGQLGVNNASFGAGVGLPVIRGHTGNRVRVLQSGVGSIDASAFSPDHANSLEAALAERIEVLRGPATLLYGNGAIGGVVNVIDNRIPESVPDELSALIETRHNTASDQQLSVFKLDGGKGQLAWHIDGVYRESNDVEIRGYAINPDVIHRDEPEDLERLVASRGRIANSNSRANSRSAGASYVFSESGPFSGGFLGASISRSDNNYGLPPGAHAHHDDDHEREDEHDEHHEHEHEGPVRIDMRQRKADFELNLPLQQLSPGGPFSELHGRVSSVDYRHVEIEGEGEHATIGTTYSNEGVEGRFSLHQRPVAHDLGTVEGVIGLALSSSDFSATGEEAYIPPTDIRSLALFTVQSLSRGDITYEMGLRGERQQHNQSGGRCDQSETSVSGSLAGIWNIRSDRNVLVSLAHSQRAPSVEELYSNVDPDSCSAANDSELIAHAATQRHEVGNPGAERERSTNFEIGIRKHQGEARGEFNVFYNNIRDYLYLQDTGMFTDEVEVSRIVQQDAVFRGVEAELSFPLNFPTYLSGRFAVFGENHGTELALFGDYVEAEFDSGEKVPRIPALRLGAELTHTHEAWLYQLRFTRVAGQSDVAANETETDGYNLLSAYADYHLTVAGEELTVFLKGDNLLNEEIRSHTSLLKDVAPEPGRAFELGLRLAF